MGSRASASIWYGVTLASVPWGADSDFEKWYAAQKGIIAPSSKYPNYRHHEGGAYESDAEFRARLTDADKAVIAEHRQYNELVCKIAEKLPVEVVNHCGYEGESEYFCVRLKEPVFSAECGAPEPLDLIYRATDAQDREIREMCRLLGFEPELIRWHLSAFFG